MLRSILRPAVLAAAAVAGSLFAAPRASAQVIYEPVRYQYGSGANVYYYGGSNPRLFDFADASPSFEPRCDVARSVKVVARQVVYSDATGYRDAAAGYGYTPTDARNEAYDNAPRYFRKADLRFLVTPTPGGWVVPAQAEPRTIGVHRPLRIPEPTPPGTILIIPRKMLEKKTEPLVVMGK